MCQVLHAPHLARPVLHHDDPRAELDEAFPVHPVGVPVVEDDERVLKRVKQEQPAA